jgi:hypothetical protein
MLVVAVLISGVGLVAFVGQRGDDRTWSRWSSVGEAFGAMNSVISALALATLVITWSLQSRDMRGQRSELADQRRTLEGLEAAQRRSADVDVRGLHVALIRIALEQKHLAEVWPSGGLADSVTRSQHMYANLLIQHMWLQYTIGIASREEMISSLRYLFASPKVRAFWSDTANSRHNIYVEGSQESDLAKATDTREYEAVLACTEEEATPPRGDHDCLEAGHPTDQPK